MRLVASAATAANHDLLWGELMTRGRARKGVQRLAHGRSWHIPPVPHLPKVCPAPKPDPQLHNCAPEQERDNRLRPPPREAQVPPTRRWIW